MNTAKATKSDYFSNDEYVSIYSRAQAIEDGLLVAIDSKISKEAGIRLPVAVTRTVWDKYIGWTDEDTKRQTVQDTEGRLWDVLYMLRLAITSLKDKTANCLFYSLYVVPKGGRARRPRRIELKALVGGGDKGEPVITIMLPDED